MFKELEVSGVGIGMFFLLLALLTIGLILYFKLKYKKYSVEELSAANTSAKSNRLNLKKFPEVDVFKNSGSFFNFGMTAAVAIALVTMSWTTYDKVVKVPDGALVFDEEMEVDIPRTAEPPPPPPPPPPPVIQEVPDTEVIQEDQPKFENQEVTEETKVEAPVVKAAPPPPPPPPPLLPPPNPPPPLPPRPPRFLRWKASPPM